MSACHVLRPFTAKVAAAVVLAVLWAVPSFAQDEVFSGVEEFSLQSLVSDGPDECGDDPCHGIRIGGWTQIGYHNESNGVFNTHPNRIRLHQQWLYAERIADGSKGFDWGFRGDLMYGVDGANTQAFGNPPGTWDYMNGFDHGIYGWAIPQLYGEVAYGPVSVKVGHFYTIIGYEVVPATGNFFYSRAFTFNFNEPFTHTGALATVKVNDGVELYGGWTAGWDTGFERFNDGDNSDGSNFLGGFKLQMFDSMSLIYAMTLGDLGWKGEGYTHSVVIDWAITDKINYVFHTDLVETNVAPGNHSWSWNNYLFYTFNDKWKAGSRMEWWKSGSHVISAFTMGVNYRPIKNFVIRPEVRWQTGDTDNDEAYFGDGLTLNGATTGGFGIPTGDTIFGIDAILTY